MIPDILHSKHCWGGTQFIWNSQTEIPIICHNESTFHYEEDMPAAEKLVYLDSPFLKSV